MNVDVSPDGAELLFDLLGDIYTVPSAVRAHTHVRCVTTDDRGLRAAVRRAVRRSSCVEDLPSRYRPATTPAVRGSSLPGTLNACSTRHQSRVGLTNVHVSRCCSDCAATCLAATTSGSWTGMTRPTPSKSRTSPITSSRKRPPSYPYGRICLSSAPFLLLLPIGMLCGLPMVSR